MTPEQYSRLTPDEKRDYARLIVRRRRIDREREEIGKIDLARKSLLRFTQYTSSEYRAARFHEYICSRLDAVLSGEVLRLIVQVGPRRGKSELVSRRLPAFALGRNPKRNIIACSYSDDLASRNNRDVQRIILSDGFRQLFPAVTLSGKHAVSDSDSSWLRNSSLFEIVGHGGMYRSAGIGGGISGMGFNLGILDDVLKNSEEAESQVVRDKHWEWYESTFRTRAAPGAAIVVIGTRWHSDDLIGRLLKQSKDNPSADQWELISFPEIAESPEWYDERMTGEYLWPEQFSPEEVERTRSSLTSYAWSALYQQSPISKSGNAIRRAWLEELCMFFKPEDVVAITLRYDVAFSDSPTADWTWGSLKAKMKDGSLLTLFQHFGHWSNQQRREAIAQFGLQVKAMQEKLMPNIKWNIGLEAGIGAGVDVVKEDVTLLISKGLAAKAIPVSKVSKAVRANSWLSSCENKQTKFYAGTQLSDFGMFDGINRWINPFLNAALLLRYTDDGLNFTGGKDDMIDAEDSAHDELTHEPTMVGRSFLL